MENIKVRVGNMEDIVKKRNMCLFRILDVQKNRIEVICGDIIIIFIVVFIFWVF